MSDRRQQMPRRPATKLPHLVKKMRKSAQASPRVRRPRRTK
jgi:hypothetical protein